jgi:hypothetical protein
MVVQCRWQQGGAHVTRIGHVLGTIQLARVKVVNVHVGK